MSLPGKRGHPLLERLLGVGAVRQAFAATQTRLQRQREWLVELEHRLDWPEDFQPSPKTADQVRHKVQTYLDQLATEATDETDQEVAQHIGQTFRNRWWGLFTCYQVAGLPRTNNELEIFMRHLKTNQRRITGRKAVHDFILRYGRCAAFVDGAENREQLQTRLDQVPYDAFVKERAALQEVEAGFQLQHRFQHHREKLLNRLEQRWEEAINASDPGDDNPNL